MRYTPNSIKRALTENVVNTISKYYTDRNSYDRKALDRIATDCIYAITLKADEHRARAVKAQAPEYGHVAEDRYNPRPYTDVTFEFTEINFIINHANALVYGSKWREPSRRDQLPVAAFFIDADGSRNWKEAPPLKDLKGAHAHGLIGFPESHIDRAHEVMPTLMELITKKNRLLFNRYEIARFDPARVKMELKDRSVLENYVEYSLKGTAHLMADGYRRGADMWPGELYRIYPNPTGDSYGYPLPPVGSPDRKVPFEAQSKGNGVAMLRATPFVRS